MVDFPQPADELTLEMDFLCCLTYPKHQLALRIVLALSKHLLISSLFRIPRTNLYAEVIEHFNVTIGVCEIDVFEFNSNSTLTRWHLFAFVCQFRLGRTNRDDSICRCGGFRKATNVSVRFDLFLLYWKRTLVRRRKMSQRPGHPGWQTCK